MFSGDDLAAGSADVLYVKIKTTAWNSWVRHLKTDPLWKRQICTAQPTWYSLDDRFHLSWQGAAELTCCSWADSWVDKLQLSWQTTAQPTRSSWHDKFLSWHVATELTCRNWADSWVDVLQLVWQIAAELTVTVTKVIQMVEKW